MKEIFESLSEIVSEECFEDICSLVEEYINEVSVGMWTRAAKNSLGNRTKQAETSKRQADYVEKNTSMYVNDYIKPDREFTKKGTKREKFKESDYDYDAYDNAQQNVKSFKGKASADQKRAERAKKIADLGYSDKSRTSARKLFDAARNSVKDRWGKSSDRFARAENTKELDPNMKSKNQKESHARKVVSNLEKEQNDKDRKELSKNKKTYVNYGIEDKLNDQLKRTSKDSAQAKTDHENAQINQALRNKLENTYKNSKD